MTHEIDMPRRRLIHTGLTLAAGAALAPLPFRAAKASAPHRMLFAHTFSQSSEKYVVTGIELFKELAEKYSEGQLSVDLHEGGKLGGQTELPQKVQYGAIQACQVSAQNFTPYAEVFNLLDLPFLFPDKDAFNTYLESPEFAASDFMTQPARKGLRILPGMWANTGFRVICASKRNNRRIHVPQDLDGVKLRVTNSKIEQQTFALTPASPVSINWAETYQAMQQGAVDALHVGLGPLTANRIHEVLSTCTRVSMSFNAHVAMVSRSWYDKLPAAIREAIDRAAAECWEYQKRQQAMADDAMWSEWKAAGIEIIDPSGEEHDRWLEAVGHRRPEWAPWKKRYGNALYEQITAFTAKKTA